MLDQKILHELFEYRDGLLYKKTGCKGRGGISSYTIKGGSFRVSHIIFTMFYGYNPSIVGFFDGNAKNTRIENLRGFSNRSQVGFTRKVGINNTSGYTGVSFHTAAKKWTAQIKINNKRIHLGIFTDKEEAQQAYCRAAKIYHKL